MGIVEIFPHLRFPGGRHLVVLGDTWLVGETEGRIWALPPEGRGGEATLVLDLPALRNTSCLLLGMAAQRHPEEVDQMPPPRPLRLLVSYQCQEPTVVSRFVVHPGGGHEERLLTVPRLTGEPLALPLAVAPDGAVLAAVPSPPDSREKGKVFRLPQEGPPEVWATGFRAPLTLAAPAEGEPTISDHNPPPSPHELNLLRPNRDYGWPEQVGRRCHTHASGCPGSVQPALLVPGGRGPLVGGFIYRHSAHPALSGWWIYGEQQRGRIWAANAALHPPRHERMLVDTEKVLHALTVDATGRLVFLAAIPPAPGRLYRLYTR